jgi:hypothetical protein
MKILIKRLCKNSICLIFCLSLGLIYSGCESDKGTSSTSGSIMQAMVNDIQMPTVVNDMLMPVINDQMTSNQVDQGMTVSMDQMIEVDQAVPMNTDPFEVMIHDQVRIVSYGEENFQNAFGSFDLGTGPFESVILEINLDTTCYPFERWRDDPPPTGHNWPPSCDAFDRNFELVLNPVQNEGDPPGIEIMRAITPFGGPSHYEIDITDLANAQPGMHRTKTHITTWSDSDGQVSGSQGGWTVSLKAKIVPGVAPRSVIAVIPLINTSVNSVEELPRPYFNTPEGVSSTRLEYRVTGHGGGNDSDNDCIGPAEEFCRRDHIIYVDGQEVEQFVPWRDNCEEECTLATQNNGNSSFEYCLENPTGSIGSVRAPRANWCPGSLTPPRVWDFDVYHTPGRHSFRFDVLDMHANGRWRVSAHVYLFGP